MSSPRLFCIGRNYAEHARELGNAVPPPSGPPVIFMKPASALVAPGQRIPWPQHGHDLHFETELVVQIGRSGRITDETNAVDFISGFTLGFDLTLRDIQDQLKKSGQPWERAKAFDGSAPCGPIVPATLQRFQFEGVINGQVRQSGDTDDMLFSISRILVELGKVWALQPGDLIFTGTPTGVGPLRPGDQLQARSPALGDWSWQIG